MVSQEVLDAAVAAVKRVHDTYVQHEYEVEDRCLYCEGLDANGEWVSDDEGEVPCTYAVRLVDECEKSRPCRTVTEIQLVAAEWCARIEKLAAADAEKEAMLALCEEEDVGPKEFRVVTTTWSAEGSRQWVTTEVWRGSDPVAAKTAYLEYRANDTRIPGSRYHRTCAHSRPAW